MDYNNSNHVVHRDILKGRLSPSEKICFICFNESPLNMIKNAFYITLKDFFVLKIFTFLSWLFARVEETG